MSIERPKSIEDIKSGLDSFGELVNEARMALIKEFPEYANVVDSKAGRHLVDGFVGDMLSVSGIESASIFHRLPPDEQKELLGMFKPQDFFRNIPKDLKDFYEEKLKAQEKN